MALSTTILTFVWRRNPFHPTIFFVLFACVDVFFPALYWEQYGQVGNPEWLTPLTSEKVYSAILFYSIFFFIFITSFLVTEGRLRPNFRRTQPSVAIHTRLPAALYILLALTLVKLGIEIQSRGGLDAWIFSKVVFAVNGSNIGAEDSLGPLTALPLRELFQASVGLAFFYRRHLRSTWLFTYVFPVIAVLLAMATFLRGTVLFCLISLVFAEFMRQLVAPKASTSKIRTRKTLGAVAVALLAGFFSIYLYGAVRDGFRDAAKQDESVEFILATPTFLTAGHGLLGVSHILAEYGHSVNYLSGKTYIDMLLLPVPRSIYTSKPAWYGIDDITRGMGWPESTQSAVTMPGEAFANFGVFGIILAIPLGMVFGWTQRIVRSDPVRLMLLGPTLFFQVTSVASWMSFTGIMNSAPVLAILFVVAFYFNRKPTVARKPLSTHSMNGSLRGDQAAGTSVSI